MQFNPNQPQQLQFSGYVEQIIFENDTHFKIISVSVDDADFSWDEPDIVVTGNFGDIQTDLSYEFSGELVMHPQYGRQFKVSTYQQITPSTSKGLVDYFSSGQFMGIGQKTAEKIVDAFGNDAINEVLNHPTELERLGVKPKTADLFVKTLRQKQGQNELIRQLAPYDINAETAIRIYDHFGSTSMDKINDDPYRLQYEIDGFGFKQADAIARKIGIQLNDVRRLKASLVAALTNAAYDSGDMYLSTSELFQKASQLLDDRQQLFKPQLTTGLQELITQELIFEMPEGYYEAKLFTAQKQIITDLNRLAAGESKVDFQVDDFEAIDAKLDEHQQAAVEDALANQIYLLTGGPGTGKTTIIKAIVLLWQRRVRNMREADEINSDEFKALHHVLLAAPTGKAARRMSELTGKQAVTIHRLLGFNGFDEPDFNADNQLSGGLLIIDELSMVDTMLFSQVLAALRTDMKIILVGDQDQLPSVGPGSVFADLLHSQKFEQTELQYIYRQDRGSTILELAAAVKQGSLPADFDQKTIDRSFIPAQAEQIPHLLERILPAAVANGYDKQDIQILAPMYRGEAGVDHLNEVGQMLLNADEIEKPGLKGLKSAFHHGDRILQLVNDNETGVYNGDDGVVSLLKPKKQNPDQTEDELVVKFGDENVTYERREWNRVALAYAMTVHKSQGSEYPLVILVLVNQFMPLSNRNLLYTAISRASDALIMIGEKSAFARSAEQSAESRHTSLAAWLNDTAVSEMLIEKETVNEPEAQVAKQPIIDLEHADPMVGMAGLRIEDF